MGGGRGAAGAGDLAAEGHRDLLILGQLVDVHHGYSDLGRFSARHRDEFDEMPSRALEATRPRT